MGRIVNYSSFQQSVPCRQLSTGSRQTATDHCQKVLEQVIAKFVVLLALPAQPFGIQCQSRNTVKGATVKLPLVRRQQPRPANHLPRRDGLDWARLVPARATFDRDNTRLDEKNEVAGSPSRPR